MIPIYFPFTYVSQRAAAALATYFRRVTVYQASARQVPADMRQLVENGFLNVRVPVATDQAKLDSVVKNFKNWAALHHHNLGLKTSFPQSGMEPIPFFDDSAASQIVADIKSDLRRKTPPAGPDPLFSARVFLEFAQEFDRQSYEARQDLRAYEKRAENFFKDIKGENEDQMLKTPLGFETITSDPSEYMISRRLDTWTYLYHLDSESCGVFITSNPAIVELMTEKIAGTEKIYRLDTVPELTGSDKSLQAWQDNLLANMVRLAKSKWPTSTDEPANADFNKMVASKTALTVYVLPDMPPQACFTKPISKKFPQPDRQHRKSPIRNTVIGLIEL